jgi:hypothetical protein
MERQDATKILEQFHEDCHWRDLIAFTWNIKTMSGKKSRKRDVEWTAFYDRA